MNLISIIIPTYDRGTEILNAIDSVLGQTNPNWELIIVDDGSLDNTKSFIKPYLEDTRIKYLYQENKGVSSARNYGVSKANGSHIVFLDSDDEFMPRLIEELIKIEYYNYDLISWPIIRNSESYQKINYHQKLGSLFNHIKILFLAGSVCYKKSFFLKVGGYDEKLTFGENYELGLRVSQMDYSLKLLNYPAHTYNVRQNRTSNLVQNRLYSGIHQYKIHHKRYVEHPYYDSEMTYILGYLFEKTGKMKTAYQFYGYSWKVYPLNYKAFLKVILLKTMDFIK